MKQNTTAEDTPVCPKCGRDLMFLTYGAVCEHCGGIFDTKKLLKKK